jgi:hypothetical protein
MPAATAPPGTNNFSATFEVYVLNTATGREVPGSSSGPFVPNWTDAPDGRPQLNIATNLPGSRESFQTATILYARPGVAQFDNRITVMSAVSMDEPLQIPIDGVLDLHTFKPGEIKDLIPDYLAACRQQGICQVRIIHGKGIGNLRRTVHAILARHPEVVSFTLDHPEYGGWGATIVRLRQPRPSSP